MAASGRSSQDVEAPPVPPTTKETNPHEQTSEESESQYPSPARTWLVMVALYISMFLVALDKTILATAVPYVSNAFHSLGDIGWYASAYMLTLCSTQLLWGRIYTLFPPKTIFLSALVVFELGSVICGAAPTSAVFILGRAIAGAGSAGISSGAIVIIVRTVPLHKRPTFQGLIGAVFGIASLLGPIVGGAFTEKVSWRWCFYINLPCGAVSAVLVVVLLRGMAEGAVVVSGIEEEKNVADEAQEPSRAPGWLERLGQKLLRLDPIGTVLFLGSIVSLLLALQWGGTTYSWSNWRIIFLFVLFPVLFILFLVVQFLQPHNATLPLGILADRNIAFSFLYTSTSQGAMLVLTYYIPLFFQALQRRSPLSSGLATLPSILSLVVGTIFAGRLVTRIGYPAPMMYVSCVLSSIGAGLISTWTINVRQGKWIGYQVLYGLGTGLGMQQPSIMAQIVLKDKDVPIGVALMILGQNFGGAVFIAVAQSLFTDTLTRNLNKIEGLHFTKQELVKMGATSLLRAVPRELVGRVMAEYHVAVRNTFYLGVALASFSAIGAAGVQWRSVKEKIAELKAQGKKAVRL